ncbi:MAG: preprotein translocase subunit YajC [Oscillospiraceae bacterium]
MRNSLSLGDEITTIGGMTGKIVQVTEDTVTFETGEDRVRIRSRSGAFPPPLRWKQPKLKRAAARARKSNITRIISASR